MGLLCTLFVFIPSPLHPSLPITDWQQQISQLKESQTKSPSQQANIFNINDNHCNKLKTDDMLKFRSEDFYGYIVKALYGRPKQTCVHERLPDYVLKQMGLRTRGEPRERIVAMIRKAIRHLENEGKVEFYKAKNNRIRLLKAGLQMLERNNM